MPRCVAPLHVLFPTSKSEGLPRDIGASAMALRATMKPFQTLQRRTKIVEKKVLHSTEVAPADFPLTESCKTCHGWLVIFSIIYHSIKCPS